MFRSDGHVMGLEENYGVLARARKNQSAAARNGSRNLRAKNYPCPGPGRIDEEFRQVGANYAHKSEGTGLGLTLGQEVCRAARREDLGGERSRQRLHLYLYPTHPLILDFRFSILD